MELTYEALDQKGNPVSDVLTANSVDEALEELHRRGLYVRNIIEASKGRVKGVRARGVASERTSMSLKRLVYFTKQMNMLLKAGSSVVPALQTVRLQLKNRDHVAMIDSMIRDVEGGSPLSDAMSRFSRCFDSGYRAIVAAGEASATLPEMFNRLARIVAKRKAVRAKLIGGMTYPALLTLLSINVVVTLLLFVIPRFGGLFETLHADIPVSTKFFLALSNFLVARWKWLLGVVVGGLAFAIWFMLSARGKALFINVQTELPGLGWLAKKLLQGEVFRTLGMLLECRVGLLDAVELARGVTGNQRFQKLLDDVVEGVTSGQSMSSALKKCSWIEPVLAHSIQIGEDNGHLAAAVNYCADILEEENTELIATVTRLIEPIILIIMGIVVGAVAISLFMPLFDLTASMR